MSTNPYREPAERLEEPAPIHVPHDAWLTILRTMAIIWLAALFLSGVGTALEGCLGYP